MRAVRLAAVALLAVSACTATSTSMSADRPAAWRSYDCQAAIGSRPDASDEPSFPRSDWKTDFSRHCVPLSEITSGGPRPDGIPPIDRPAFEPLASVKWLDPREPVIALALDGTARAYPLQILVWHEIVNDTVAGHPVVVTFCPLCNTALVFKSELEGRAMTFGTTGLLRRSDLVMWDRQTQTWWQQATGEAIVGELTGRRLERISAQVLSFDEFGRAYPEGSVLSRAAANEEAKAKTGSGRQYGTNPYAGYDRPDTGPISGFWLGPDIDKRLSPKARIAATEATKPPVAYPIDGLSGAVARNDIVGGTELALLYLGGVASPLDKNAIAEGADIGQAALFSRVAKGRTLTFTASGRAFRDDQTGSTWTITGEAVSGPLAGTRLDVVPHEVTFWFVWAVFRPETEIRR